MLTVLLIIFCILLNGALAAIEIAFVSVNKVYVKNRAGEGDSSAKKLHSLIMNPERTLSTIQIGITFVASFSSAIGGAAAEVSIVPILQEQFKLTFTVAQIVALLFVVIPITYLSVVIGEITPKALALRNPYYFAAHGSRVLSFLSRVLYPLARICEISTKKLLSWVSRSKYLAKGQDGEDKEYERVVTGYFKLPQKGREYAINLYKIQEKSIGEIMLEWKKVDYVTMDQDLDQILEKTVSSGHTRLPVVEGDKVVGMLNTKEILALSRNEKFDWKILMHGPLKFTKESSPIKALTKLQSNRAHMGIVEDEEGLPLGVVTIEDIIEEILGEIYDEDDQGSIKRILE